METKSTFIGLIIGVLLGGVGVYILAPSPTSTNSGPASQSLITQEQYNKLSNDYSTLQNAYNKLKTDYDNLKNSHNSLENAYESLQNTVSELQAELAKYIPPETGELGKSRFNPAPIETVLYIDFAVGGEGDYSSKMNVVEVIRGELALEKIIEADGYLRELWYDVEKYQNLTAQYLKDFGANSVYYMNVRDQLEYALDRWDRNNPLDDGYEFLLVKVRFEFLAGSSSITLNAQHFRAVSDLGIVYDVPSVEVPSPKFDIEMLPKSIFEGWCVYEVLIEDEQPKLCFATHPDGTGGLWFKLYE